MMLSPPTPPALFLSPSLVGAEENDGSAYELKFLLAEARAAEVESWARGRLQPDPHADPARAAYRTTTLYCDTPDGDVYWRTLAYRRSKFRVRRYGGKGPVFLERKTRRGDRVAKLRTAVAHGDLDLLASEPAPAWPGTWFSGQLAAAGLRPAALVGYERVALVGHAAEGGLRLTLDRGLWGVPWQRWDLPAECDGTPFLCSQVIVEVKFRVALPALFREMIALFGLCPAAVSKYRQGLDACGVWPTARLRSGQENHESRGGEGAPGRVQANSGG